MGRFFDFLLRGLMLRCPVCARGHIFASPFKINKQCPVCHFSFEREEGYFSSSMAINLVLSELIVTAVILPMAINPAISPFTALALCIPLAILLPFALYHHSRSLWMSMDHYMNPPRGLPRPPTNWSETHE